MKDIFEKLGDRIRTLLAGRCGMDHFSRFLVVAALIFYILSLVLRSGLLYLLAAFGITLCWLRMLSKDFGKRTAENERFLAAANAVRAAAEREKQRLDGRRYYRYFRCPACGQEVRVPKGKGHIRITCPKCRTQFDRTV